MREKLFVGQKVRRLRIERGWKLEACAVKVGVSPSYLSQIETNQRPVTERVLVSLMEIFETGAAAFDAGDDKRLVADLREATLDAAMGHAPAPLSEIRQVAIASPTLAQQFLSLHRAYRQLEQRLAAVDQALALDESSAVSAPLPYEEVRDYFHYKDNYIHALDTAAEAAAGLMAAEGSPEQRFERWLAERHGIRVNWSQDPDSGVLRRYDAAARTVHIDAVQPSSSRAFQLAYQIASLEFGALIEAELAAAGLRGPDAAAVCRVGLTNYAAGALMMPYSRFQAAAQATRHDLERLQQHFQASLEQVCHRLSNLQRPGQRGTPFYFVRIDIAGNITKRHSATPLQFARFGGACPLWNVHEAFSRPGEFLTQVAETPDGVRHLGIAISVVKRSGSFDQPPRKYALGLGCEIHHAHKVIYADGLDLAGRATPIGISCRICERDDCRQRAFPALDRSLRVPVDMREIVPYRLESEPARTAGQPAGPQ
jgi:predicted transcriptional regulator/transcriptional regulator with XRE-family HTH domain